MVCNMELEYTYWCSGCGTTISISRYFWQEMRSHKPHCPRCRENLMVITNRVHICIEDEDPMWSIPLHIPTFSPLGNRKDGLQWP